jgi:hypothetical protein
LSSSRSSNSFAAALGCLEGSHEYHPGHNERILKPNSASAAAIVFGESSSLSSEHRGLCHAAAGTPGGGVGRNPEDFVIENDHEFILTEEVRIPHSFDRGSIGLPRVHGAVHRLRYVRAESSTGHRFDAMTGGVSEGSCKLSSRQPPGFAQCFPLRSLHPESRLVDGTARSFILSGVTPIAHVHARSREPPLCGRTFRWIA